MISMIQWNSTVPITSPGQNQKLPAMAWNTMPNATPITRHIYTLTGSFAGVKASAVPARSLFRMRNRKSASAVTTTAAIR